MIYFPGLWDWIKKFKALESVLFLVLDKYQRRNSSFSFIKGLQKLLKGIIYRAAISLASFKIFKVIKSLNQSITIGTRKKIGQKRSFVSSYKMWTKIGFSENSNYPTDARKFSSSILETKLYLNWVKCDIQCKPATNIAKEM